MIRVGFDISQLAHLGGVNTYTKNLTEELSKIEDLEMVYFYSSLRQPYKGNLKGVKSYRLPPTLFEVLFNKIRSVPIEKFVGSVDVFHSSDWVQPPTRAKKVTTVHDAVALKYPQWSHPKIVQVHKRRLKLIEEEVDIVIAVSSATKKDLLEVSKIPSEKIYVVYEGPTADFKIQPKQKVEEFGKKYNLPKEFVLAISGVGERRNIERIRQASSGYPLIVTGEDIPWLGVEELELLYQSASVLVYASLYEGFGIPILDAFLNHLPVITSNISSMPEVAGEGAVLVDPLKVDDIKAKIKMVMEDAKLREELIEKGIKQASNFSWKKAAQETVEIYRQLKGI